ncbi:MAG: winged helix-turn-helix domain-containing protein [Acidobacteria bacterium]|nr:winged helix-turn-helix domain-containing protein [Acidobacteriota bacterium]
MKSEITLIPDGDYHDRYLKVTVSQRRVHVDGEQRHLPDREFILLAALIANAGQVLDRAMVLERLWNGDLGPKSRTLDVHIHRIRARLGKHGPKYIETVFGKGYRFNPQSEVPRV